MRTPSVAVVGGGASGALTAIHLLRLARTSGTPMAVTLLDQHGRHALGQAYATTDPHHLLNTRADRMSAFDGEPDHLLTWARNAGVDVNGSGYLPRALYGRYLREVLTAAEDPPARPLHRVTATAVALDNDHAVRLADGRRVDADAVVLALGNRSPAPVPGLTAHPRYVTDPWAGGALTGIGDGAAVLVLGTGLTMVDVALSVTLRRVARYWEIHRHRIPPASAAAIADLRARGRLRLLRGSLVEAKPAADGLRVRADLDGTMTDLDVGWLVNATGPSADVTTDPFLANLITAGTARPDPLRLGLDATPDGAVLDVAGQPSGRLFALGPLLRGTLYETTAVPEIRAQAAALAPRLVEVATSHAARTQPVA
ncbi:FAD/NAD(P)-binding protein [Nonomuraea sp. NPDC026600]|uniref:FAD/NAD(P)-binding protein n=1 Tax=Nonomuraea sp. NPDC026600 TaxID=3155363 RepID=UPI0033FFD270